MPQPTAYPMVESIIAYEAGELDDYETVVMFAELIRSKMAWSLQGSYGRTAQHFIDNGWITREGAITTLLLDLL